jgi:3-keto-disaccharide hydrolase
MKSSLAIHSVLLRTGFKTEGRPANERASDLTRAERGSRGPRERACRGVRGAKPLGVITLCAATLTLVSARPVAAPQQTTAPQTGRGGGVYPQTEPDDNTGFVPIFDGKTLNGWDGDTTFWRVENGEIIGETTPEKIVKLNNFLIWRGGTVRDFELKVEFRMNGTNSGIQYRSSELPNIGKWVLKGYQADMDFTEGYVGNVHDERGRAPTGEGHVVLSKRGQVTRIVDGPRYKVVGTIGDSTLLRGVMNVNGWNQYHIIARGPVLMQLINGQLMAVALDEDSQHYAAEGLLGFQMHVGPPFKIEYRNVLYRKIQ